MDGKKIEFDKVKILPPEPGSCPLCARKHPANAPHDRDSLYYQMTFYQKNGRFPTWADAMRHCKEPVREAWLLALKWHNIPEEVIGTFEEEPDGKRGKK